MKNDTLTSIVVRQDFFANGTKYRVLIIQMQHEMSKSARNVVPYFISSPYFPTMPSSFPLLHDYLQADPTTLPDQVPAFLEHLFSKIDSHIAKGGRILLLTLTKKSSEEITNFLLGKGYKAFYLHSEIETLKRREILKKLRNGTVDILVGINLLREGIDLPEVSLIAILDADKEGFLRSTTSLVQIIGRAARNPNGEVILYADKVTPSILASMHETYRRRRIQQAHNDHHGITPTQAISNIKNIETVKSDDDLQAFHSMSNAHNEKKLKRMTKKEKEMIHDDLKVQLKQAVDLWDFEKAAVIRDQIRDLMGQDSGVVGGKGESDNDE